MIKHLVSCSRTVLESARCVVIFLILTTILGGCRAQDYNITVDIYNRSGSVIIPDRADYLIVTAKTPINIANVTIITSNDPDFVIRVDNITCEAEVCSLSLVDTHVDLNATIRLFFTNGTHIQILNVTIKEYLDAACRDFNMPQKFQADPRVTTYNFSCIPHIPPEVNATDPMIVWRKFRLHEEVEKFQRNGVGFEDKIVTTSGLFSITSNGEIFNVTNDRNRNHLAFYYVPSFNLSNFARELVTAESIIYVEPFITSPHMEFSVEIIFYDDNPRLNITNLHCETFSFPPARVTWVLSSHDIFPKGVNLSELPAQRNGGRFSTMDTGNITEVTLTFNGQLILTNLTYDDDGFFTCFVTNEFLTISSAVRVRVKSHLRPLWPAIGIMAVILLMSIFMLSHLLVDKFIEKRREKKNYPLVAEDTDNGQQLSPISKGVHHHNQVKRLSSAKPLLEESTL